MSLDEDGDGGQRGGRGAGGSIASRIGGPARHVPYGSSSHNNHNVYATQRTRYFGSGNNRGNPYQTRGDRSGGGGGEGRDQVRFDRPHPATVDDESKGGVVRLSAHGRFCVVDPEAAAQFAEDNKITSRGTRLNGIRDTPEMYTGNYPWAFKEWIMAQPRHVNEEEIARAYGAYKERFENQQLFLYFKACKDEIWFAERYAAENEASYRDEQLQQLTTNHAQFRADLNAGRYDNVDLTMEEFLKATPQQQQQQHNKPIQVAEGVITETNEMDEDQNSQRNVEKEENASVSGPSFAQMTQEQLVAAVQECGLPAGYIIPRKGPRSGCCSSDLKQTVEALQAQHIAILPASHSLLIRAFPVQMSKKNITDEFKNEPGFLRVATSEPAAYKRNQRNARVLFDRSTDLQAVYEKHQHVVIPDTQIKATVSPPAESLMAFRVKWTPSIATTEERLREDLRHSRSIVAHFSQKSQLEDLTAARCASATDASTEIGVVRKMLDLTLMYLRRVFMFCYYCGGSAGAADSNEELVRRCGVAHLRRPITPEEVKEGFTESHPHYAASKRWIASLERTVDALMRSGQYRATLRSFNLKTAEEIEMLSMRPLYGVEENDKHRCRRCLKLFKGFDFIAKHLRNKHAEELPAVDPEVDLWMRYLSDPLRVSSNLQQLMNANHSGTMRLIPHSAYGGGNSGDLNRENALRSQRNRWHDLDAPGGLPAAGTQKAGAAGGRKLQIYGEESGAEQNAEIASHSVKDSEMENAETEANNNNHDAQQLTAAIPVAMDPFAPLAYD